MDVLSAEFLDDPYRFYRERRQSFPVCAIRPHAWTLTGYEEMAAVLANPAAGRGNVGRLPTPGGDTTVLDTIRRENPALKMLEDWMLFQNPPEHGRVRGLVAKAFTAKVVAGLEPMIRSTVRGLIDEAKRGTGEGALDFVARIARPLPEAVACELIGIPPADRYRFGEWTRELSQAVEVDFLSVDAPMRARLNRAARALTGYFDGLVARKEPSDDGDLMSRLLRSSEQSDGLSREQILANCVFLLFAGQDTMTSLLSNGVSALLTHREQWETLRSAPDLVPGAVEECLRYDPSIQMVGRYALDSIQAGSHRIEKGHHIFAFLGAAGRDPAANPDPDRFDVTRTGVRHLAFARGAHHCLGATLARLQARVALEELLERLPGLRLVEAGTRRGTWLMRGFASLPVEL